MPLAAPRVLFWDGSALALAALIEMNKSGPVLPEDGGDVVLLTPFVDDQLEGKIDLSLIGGGADATASCYDAMDQAKAIAVPML